ncbi:MAG: iron-sulfur cluster assembly accessory protein [Euryarchaeota archaeon]|nr:iron-sulfur cluster assembly accessory protein [Euryarchaeota archaeon]
MVSRLDSAKPEPVSVTSAFDMVVSDPALEQIKGLLKGQKPGMAVRVFVQMGGGGGCCGGGSGPAFGMAFDKPKNGDEVVKRDGVNFVVDPYSVEFLNGANVDFVKENGDSGFKITNPTLPMSEAGSGGGCGSCGASSDNGGSCGCGSGGGGCC